MKRKKLIFQSTAVVIECIVTQSMQSSVDKFFLFLTKSLSVEYIRQEKGNQTMALSINRPTTLKLQQNQ